MFRRHIIATCCCLLATALTACAAEPTATTVARQTIGRDTPIPESTATVTPSATVVLTATPTTEPTPDYSDGHPGQPIIAEPRQVPALGLNPLRALGLIDTELIEVDLQTTAGWDLAITDLQVIGSLLRAIDMEMELGGRTRCMPGLVLRFTITDDSQHELAFACNPENPDFLRGADAFFEEQDARLPDEAQQRLQPLLAALVAQALGEQDVTTANGDDAAPSEVIPEAITAALESATQYLQETYPDVAPGHDVVWDTVVATPENLVGATWYALSAPGWDSRIIAPVMAPSAVAYDITVRHADDDPHWVLRVDAAGQVEEMPNARAGATEIKTYSNPGGGFSLSFRSDWQLEEDAVVGGQKRALSLVRDGWRLVVSIADSKSALPMVMGSAAGEWQTREPLDFHAGLFDKQALVYQGKTVRLKYWAEVEGTFCYLHLLNEQSIPYGEVMAAVGLQHEIDQIAASLTLID